MIKPTPKTEQTDKINVENHKFSSFDFVSFIPIECSQCNGNFTNIVSHDYNE